MGGCVSAVVLLGFPYKVTMTAMLVIVRDSVEPLSDDGRASEENVKRTRWGREAKYQIIVWLKDRM